MINILQIAASSGRSGGETYLLELAKGLDRSRFHMGVLVPKEGPLVAELAKLKTPVGLLPMEDMSFFKAVFQLRRLIHKTQIDIVQSHGLRPNVLTRLACLRLPVRVISTYHVSPYYADVPIWKRMLYGALDRLTRRFSHELLCVSSTLTKDIAEKKERWTVIPNAVDTDRFDPKTHPRSDSKTLLGLKKGETVLVLIGRLDYEKGQKLLLEALRHLALKNLVPEVLFVGTGPLEEELRRLVQEWNLSDQCYFLGSRTDIPQILAAADLVIQPSLSEGMPYSVLEAMSMEKCVLGSSIRAIAEIIKDGENGFLFPSGKSTLLAQKIEYLLKHKDKCHETGKKARNTIKNQYNLEKWINSLQTLYECLTDRSNGRCAE